MESKAEEYRRMAEDAEKNGDETRDEAEKRKWREIAENHGGNSGPPGTVSWRRSSQALAVSSVRQTGARQPVSQSAVIKPVAPGHCRCSEKHRVRCETAGRRRAR